MDDDDFEQAYANAAAWDEANLAAWETESKTEKTELDQAWHEAWLAAYDWRGRP